MYMSSHKNEASLRSYTRNVSTEQKKALSSSLSAITLPSDENMRCETENPAGILVPFHSCHAVSHSDSPSKKTPLAISVPNNNSENVIQPTQITYQSNNSMLSHPGFFTNATFNGCTLNFTH